MSETCKTFQSRFLEVCKKSAPGLREIWIGNFSNVVGVTASATTNMIDDIIITPYDSTGSVWSSGAFFKIALPRESSSTMDELQISVENGVAIAKPSVTFKIPSWDETTREAFHELMQANVIVIAKGVNNSYWMLGRDGGLQIESGTFSSGAGATDLAGMECVLSGLEAEPMLKIDPNGTLYSAGIETLLVVATV